MKFFDILGIEPKFLDKSPRLWANDQSFVDCNEVVKCMPVTNDLAERGVKFVTDHLLKVTKDEKQFRAMLVNEWYFKKNSEYF